VTISYQNRFLAALLESSLTFKNNRAKSMTSLWQYKLFLDIRRRFLQERRQTGVGSLKSTNLPFSYCYTTSELG